MSALLAIAGITWEGDRLPTMEDLEATPGAVEALVDAADLYVQAGGVPTLAEWAALGASERAALVASRTRLLAGLIASMAAAVQSQDAAAEVASVADGGAAKRTAALHKATAAAVAAVRGGRGDL